MRALLVIRWSERYAAVGRSSSVHTPPMRAPRSNATASKPAALSARRAARPDGPAPTTAILRGVPEPAKAGDYPSNREMIGACPPAAHPESRGESSCATAPPPARCCPCRLSRATRRQPAAAGAAGNTWPSSGAAWPAWPPRTSWPSAASRSPSTSARRSAARPAASRCPKTATGGRRPLPGEHGFRFFPGFYHHVPDTMRRIPFPGNANGVWDNFEDANETSSPRTEGRADATLFGIAPDPAKMATPDGLQRVLVEELVKQQGVRPDEAEFFANRVQVFLTSQRGAPLRPVGAHHLVGLRPRRGQVGRVQEGDRPRPDPQPRRGQGDRGQHAHDRQHGRGVRDEHPAARQRRRAGPGAQRAHQRGLDRPLGRAPAQAGRALPGRATTVKALETRSGRIAAAMARDRRGRLRRIEADWFVCAMPAERARAPVVAQRAAARPEPRGHERALRGLDERDPVLPPRPVGPDPRPPDLRRRAVGADRAHPGPVLAGQRGFAARLRRRQGGGLPVGRHLRLGHARGSSTGSPPSSAPGRRSSARSGRSSRRTSRTTASRCCPTTSCTPGSSIPASAGRSAGGATATTSRCS